VRKATALCIGVWFNLITLIRQHLQSQSKRGEERMRLEGGKIIKRLLIMFSMLLIATPAQGGV
jgi:hypothetical protein